MYFKNLVEKLGEYPDYISEYMAKYQGEVQERGKPDLRKIMGEKTRILALRDATQELREKIEFIQNYIMSLQLPVLKEKIPYERSAMVPGNSVDTTAMPNRYLNRVGEVVVVVLSGSVDIFSSEFSDSATLKAGCFYRLNARVPMSYTYSQDFYAVVIAYLDFDLAHYCMPFDLYGTMPRRRDEFLDYDPNDESHKIDNFSTNDY